MQPYNSFYALNDYIPDQLQAPSCISQMNFPGTYTGAALIWLLVFHDTLTLKQIV